MQRMHVAVLAIGVVAVATMTFAQQPPGRAGEATVTRPEMLFKEEWKQPFAPGELTEENRREKRRVTQDAVANKTLELKLYGADARNILEEEHEGRHDLWTGMAKSPVAATLRDKSAYFDLTSLARLHWIIRSSNLHAVHPVLKLADGMLLVGRAIETDGQFIETEVAFGTSRWFKLDPETVVTTVEVKNPDLSRVDEIGFADLMPGGGAGNAGWINVSHTTLYGKRVPR
jgi:hypothetical protein